MYSNINNDDDFSWIDEGGYDGGGYDGDEVEQGGSQIKEHNEQPETKVVKPRTQAQPKKRTKKSNDIFDEVEFNEEEINKVDKEFVNPKELPIGQTYFGKLTKIRFDEEVGTFKFIFDVEADNPFLLGYDREPFETKWLPETKEKILVRNAIGKPVSVDRNIATIKRLTNNLWINVEKPETINIFLKLLRDFALDNLVESDENFEKVKKLKKTFEENIDKVKYSLTRKKFNPPSNPDEEYEYTEVKKLR